MAVLLIAEDEKDMQNIIVDFMKQGGHSCILANDGVEALSILENNTVDLIILDIMMPRLDGFTVCKFARNICDVPIIFLTAKGEENDKLKGYEYGADDYVTKPFSPKILLAKVNACYIHRLIQSLCLVMKLSLLIKNTNCCICSCRIKIKCSRVSSC